MAKKSIPKGVANLSAKTGPLTAIEEKLLGINDTGSSIRERPYVVLKHFDSQYQCFSEWTPDELKAFSRFIENLKQMTWGQIYQSGGKIGKKTGMGYTPHGRNVKLPDSTRRILKSISPDINFFELRISQKARVHGFQVKSAFFLVWLDRNHEICPM